ncbi:MULTISPECIES: hypothetical protein [unclassified Streptomyces]|uniref:hypothetical protein n=1 Tax=unclassified Streptomyces TaxID=2593676 RepID=UPI002E2BC371|nr:hypothetical protein [Streptomyces sp. NBC_00223]
MSTTAIIIVALVVIAAAIATLTAQRRGGHVGLKRKFGPEYDRTLARHEGDVKATRHELAERVERYGDLDPHPLTAREREAYEARWTRTQARFVDEPGAALTEADRLVGALAAERGYPGRESSEHFDALSVHHPHQVQGYRQAHETTGNGLDDGSATEDQRQALIGARELFDELLGDAPEKPERMSEDVTPEDVTPEEEATPTGDTRRPLADRFAALTGGTRKDRSEHL